MADHNASPEKGVLPNPDPALQYSHEHTHTHTHHSSTAVEGRTEISYTTGTTAERDIVASSTSPTVQQQQQHRNAKADSLGGESLDKEKRGATQVRDEEKAGFGSQDGSHQGVRAEQEEERKSKWSPSALYRRFRVYIHLFLWCLFTGWWIASLVLHRNDMNWVVPFLVYLAISLRLLTLYVPITYVTRPMRWVWRNTGTRASEMVPEKLRTPLGGVVVVGVFLIGGFASEESLDNTRENRAVSLFGLALMMVVLWATSRNRRKIRWHTVIVGMLVQFIVAVFVLRAQAGYDIFNFISGLARALLGFANQGTVFLTDDWVPELYHWFLITVLPAIIFFVALVQLLYYWGLLQWFIKKFATFFFWSMRVSGAEAVVAAASPFIGQGESAMLIKPFVAHLTHAELHQIMTSGFATIAGSVLVAYIGMGINPQALVSSCVMSIPASLAISKMRYPEEEETLTAGRVVIPDDEEHRASNGLHAFANGAWLGLKIAGMIIATLLCILALLGLANGLLTWWGRHLNINDPPLTVELIVGYICYPVAWLLGVPLRDHNVFAANGTLIADDGRRDRDLLLVGQLIGTKIVANEFVAYSRLTNATGEFTELSPRSTLIATYALCGFGNLGSLGTQIGVLSQIAPSRAGDVSQLAVSALIAGVLSTLSSASIAGLLVTDQRIQRREPVPEQEPPQPPPES